MAESTQIIFDHKEIAEVLVKYRGIHEGYWGVLLKFGIAGANAALGPEAKVLPTAIVPVQGIGIQKFDEANDLTVDAAKVNPKQPRTAKIKTVAKKK